MDVSSELQARLYRVCGECGSLEDAIETLLKDYNDAKARADGLARSLSKARRDDTMNTNKLEQAQKRVDEAETERKKLIQNNQALKSKLDEEVRQHNETKQQLQRSETSNSRVQQAFMTRIRKADQRIELLEDEGRRRLLVNQSKLNDTFTYPEIVLDEGIVAEAMDNFEQRTSRDLDQLHQRLSAMTSHISNELAEPCATPEAGIAMLVERLKACEEISADCSTRHQEETREITMRMNELNNQAVFAAKTMRRWYEFMEARLRS